MQPLADLTARLGLTWSTAAWGALLFVVTAVGSLALATAVLVRLPADYFAEGGAVLGRGGLPAKVAKNVVGAVLVVVGIVLAIPGIPGQGILTILIGVMLLDVPGKRRVERRLVALPRVHRAVDDVRARFGSPPLVLGPSIGLGERPRTK
jgi:hypothetical protein